MNNFKPECPVDARWFHNPKAKGSWQNEIVKTIHEWRWSKTSAGIPLWQALVTFDDGTHVWTYPILDKYGEPVDDCPM